MSFATTKAMLAADTTDASGVAVLQMTPEVGNLVLRVVGYGQGRLGFTPRAGYSDIVRVLTRCAVPVI